MHLHIVSFDVPFPPNYGGVIDVFYKIKALHQLGIKIHLHTYQYGRDNASQLHDYCASVIYYKRGSLSKLFSIKPYIVASRSNQTLLKNLQKDNYPILFEGIHTTYPLTQTSFPNRTIFIRTHNIEHDYYSGLAKSEKRYFKKLFFYIESIKLKKYEKIMRKASGILTISPAEQHYFASKFKNCHYIPVFHKENTIAKLSDRGHYALYHGDLRVSDNVKAVNYLISIFKDIDYPLIIATSFIHKKIENAIQNYKNITFELLDFTDNAQLDRLFKNAHINVLPTFQATGIKLKLIHALFSSRFCVVTSEMVAQTGLENLCHIGKDKVSYKDKVLQCISKSYSKEDITCKTKTLHLFDTLNNAQKILKLLK